MLDDKWYHSNIKATDFLTTWRKQISFQAQGQWHCTYGAVVMAINKLVLTNLVYNGFYGEDCCLLKRCSEQKQERERWENQNNEFKNVNKGRLIDRSFAVGLSLCTHFHITQCDPLLISAQTLEARSGFNVWNSLTCRESVGVRKWIQLWQCNNMTQHPSIRQIWTHSVHRWVHNNICQLWVIIQWCGATLITNQTMKLRELFSPERYFEFTRTVVFQPTKLIQLRCICSKPSKY